MGLDVTIQDFLYRILKDSILHRADSADAVFSILSLPKHFRGARKGPALPSPCAEKHGLTHFERFFIHLLRPVCFTAVAFCPVGVDVLLRQFQLSTPPEGAPQLPCAGLTGNPVGRIAAFWKVIINLSHSNFLIGQPFRAAVLGYMGRQRAK